MMADDHNGMARKLDRILAELGQIQVAVARLGSQVELLGKWQGDMETRMRAAERALARAMQNGNGRARGLSALAIADSIISAVIRLLILSAIIAGLLNAGDILNIIHSP